VSVQQYLRKASLIIGPSEGTGLDLSTLRFKFDIRRGDLETPNSADIRVYNVSDQTSKSVENVEFSRVVIQAGYEGNYGVIFDGQIKQVRRGRESQVDTYLDITAADGDSVYNFSMTALSLAAENSSPVDSVSAVIKGMAEFGVERGYIPDLPGDPPTRGKVLFGMSRDEMRKLARNTQTSWSIQDGKVVMIPLTAYVPGEIPVLSAETGVIGMPEQTSNGINLRLLLNPNIKIGQCVKLNNSSIQKMKFGINLSQTKTNLLTEQSNKINKEELYYVMIAEHVGDTRGNEWYTELNCLAVNADIPPSYIPKQGVYGAVGTIKRYG
jgi:hypothetical protein